MATLVEVISSPLFIGVYVAMMLLFIQFILGAKFGLFGLSFFFKKMSGKFGLVFFKTKDNNFRLPKFVMMDNDSISLKMGKEKKIFPIHPNEFQEGRFFGLPFTMKDLDDASKVYGIYGYETDDKNNVINHVINSEGKAYDTTIPKLTKYKSAYRVDPSLIDTLVSKLVMLGDVNDIKKLLLYVGGGLMVLGIIGIANIFIGYQIYVMMEQYLPGIAGKVSQAAATTIIPG